LQLGFVIDHSRCIGCHACTVACKSENEVPVGSFRTWVKYTESGTFPEVRRSFAVLRCNQCSDAPCVTICPTGALEKRPDAAGLSYAIGNVYWKMRRYEEAERWLRVRRGRVLIVCNFGDEPIEAALTAPAPGAARLLAATSQACSLGEDGAVVVAPGGLVVYEQPE